MENDCIANSSNLLYVMFHMAYWKYSDDNAIKQSVAFLADFTRRQLTFAPKTPPPLR